MSNFKFKEALEADLIDKGMTQAQLAAALSRPEEKLTEQAVSQWKAKGYPPRGRWARLQEVLGLDSRIGQADLSDVYGHLVDAPARVYRMKPRAVEVLALPIVSRQGDAPVPEYSGAGAEPDPVELRTPMGPASRAALVEQSLRSYLPQDKQRFLGEVLEYGTLKYKPTYLSPALSAEVVMYREPFTGLGQFATALIRQAVMARKLPKGSHAHLLIVVPVPYDVEPDTQARVRTQRALDKLKQDASALDVTVLRTLSIREAAETIMVMDSLPNIEGIPEDTDDFDEGGGGR